MKTMISFVVALASAFVGLRSAPLQPSYDLVIANGRWIDPETGLDAVRNVGISGGLVRAVASERLDGRTVIDASRLVVAPGFIDLHQHAQPNVNRSVDALKAMDGVTTALE